MIDAQRRMLDFEVEDEGFQVCGQGVGWSWDVWWAEFANTALFEALDLPPAASALLQYENAVCRNAYLDAPAVTGDGSAEVTAVAATVQRRVTVEDFLP